MLSMVLDVFLKIVFEMFLCISRYVYFYGFTMVYYAYYNKRKLSVIIYFDYYGYTMLLCLILQLFTLLLFIFQIIILKRFRYAMHILLHIFCKKRSISKFNA